MCDAREAKKQQKDLFALNLFFCFVFFLLFFLLKRIISEVEQVSSVAMADLKPIAECIISSG
ncbi:hypothetical protein RchiOBHm_Chr7g0223021 [Rosa chinensis]|uniref:Uncharacterized protein n=1 Tax=Rosa chinensis TaxID=74649 RepID=A0A2P6PDG0_ROSCH|nr:hypothetical protein RchiOBHm_Chr7g0223021 [Rosa chinensis]